MNACKAWSAVVARRSIVTRMVLVAALLMWGATCLPGAAGVELVTVNTLVYLLRTCPSGWSYAVSVCVTSPPGEFR